MYTREEIKLKIKLNLKQNKINCYLCGKLQYISKSRERLHNFIQIICI